MNKHKQIRTSENQHKDIKPGSGDGNGQKPSTAYSSAYALVKTSIKLIVLHLTVKYKWEKYVQWKISKGNYEFTGPRHNTVLLL